MSRSPSHAGHLQPGHGDPLHHYHLPEHTFAWIMHVIGFVPPASIAMPWTLPDRSWHISRQVTRGRRLWSHLHTFVIPGLIWYPAFKAWERIVIEKEGLETAKKPSRLPDPPQRNLVKRRRGLASNSPLICPQARDKNET